jgi:ATP-binding cassette subfamily B multidrug efflux pump
MPRLQAYARPKNVRKTLGQLIRYLGKHIWTLVLIAFLVIVSALSNLIGTYAIKDIINNSLEAGGDNSKLVVLCLEVGGIYFAGALSSLIYTQVMVGLAQEVVYEMRKDMFVNMEGLPISYFDSHSYGDIMSIFTNDVESVSDALNNAFATLIQYFVEIVGTFIFIFVLNWKLSMIVMFFYVLMIVYILYSGKKSKHYYSIQQKELGELNGFAEEIIRGEKTVKVFNHEEDAIKTFQEKNTRLQKASEGAMTYSNSMVPMVMTISYINYAIVAIVGGLIALNYPQELDIATISSYLVFVRQTAMPINRFTGQANILLNALASAERVFSVIDEEQEKDEGNVSMVRVIQKEDGSLLETSERTGHWAFKRETSNGYDLIPLKGDVRFNHVSFSYPGGPKVLNDISLYAKPGQKIAFVGSTGAGKTTITNLINRFYDISEGTITFDGIDVRDIRKDDLRRSLGIVLQDTHLFTGTIEENIKFGKLDASHEEVVQAAKLANADSFIRRLPEGYNTNLSSDGSNLSQGQRQLLAIARAAISAPPVLILDEATSSVDTHTEHLIQEGMDKLMQGRTVFVIAHRLSTVRNSNAIIVLEHGQIIERGNHDDLMKAKGRYYLLCTGQAELA